MNASLYIGIPRSGKTVSRAASWRYESNIYVNPNERQIRRPNATTSTSGATSMALQQMMPYHLVPQREAMLVQQQGWGSSFSKGTKFLF